ncbi:MAG: FAD-binding oxidoreductase [Oscillospiraceae bacterium]|nr:FAD-binding oxidoreductase [Oscillospiraceae bacterium]
MYYPKSKAELQEIIRAAREKGTPLVPVSSGTPHIHGISANEKAETLDMSKMNKIMKISRDNRYARVEVGVTFGELIPEMKKNGLRLNAPFLPRANKSVITSALEREAVLVPKYQYDYTDPLLTMEVVFGTGDDFRTGSASGPGPYEELKADMVSPWGPGTVDYQRFIMGAQGTMGIVTWGTLKAELMPTKSKLFFVEAEELSVLTKFTNELLRYRTLDDCIILNSVNLAKAFSDTAEEEQDILKRAAPWTFICRICGFDRYPEKRIEIYESYFADICQKHGIEFKSAPFGNLELAAKIDSMLWDCDRRETYWKVKKGDVREILFLTPPSKVPYLTETLKNAVSAHPAEDVGITLQPQVQGRAFRIECDLFCKSSADVEELAFNAETGLLKNGAYFDRPYSNICQEVYSIDPVGTESLRKIKNIFDPDGIFNPGKLCF